MLGGDIVIRSDGGKGSTFTALIDPGPAEAMGAPEMPNPNAATPAPGPATNAAAPKPAPPGSKPLAGVRVLVAEDGPDNQTLIRIVLRNAGAEAVIAADGVLACEAVSQAIADGKPYDVVLMDMQMPRLDGYGATAKLRKEGYAGPIIALTANAMSSDRTKCLEAGCTDFASKPIDTKKLVALIDKYRGQAKTPTPTSKAPPLSSTLAADPDMGALVQDYATKLPGRAEELLGALRSHDVDAVARLAHQLKGSAGGYGFDPITQIAAQLEQLAAQQSPANELQRTLDALVDLCHRAAAGVSRGQ
jgi:CheY-like chemotaxis protein